MGPALKTPRSVRSKSSHSKPVSLWFAANTSKRWTELFFLVYSPFWIVWALGIVVPFQLYEYAGKAGYLLIGLSAALPCVLLPLWLDPAYDRQKPWSHRYWVKANVWIAIFSYIGNYFWTHYFFRLLGAAYTFPSWRLNDVPVTLYFMTHAYFCFYHAVSNVLLRRVQHASSHLGLWPQRAAMAATVFLLSYATAYMETLTIAHFPYYTFKDRSKMYSIGSLFYAIYFFVSFPLFYRMDENPRETWTAPEAAMDALAAGMLVTILLDLWRLAVGPIVNATAAAAQSSSTGWRAYLESSLHLRELVGSRLPWLS